MGLLVEPSRPEIIIERGRQVTSEPKATVRRRTLRASEVRDGVTTPLRTVLDCMSDLPFWEALAITDSALACSQDGLALVEPLELAEAIGHMPTQYRTRAVRVADHADPRAANPFESAVRAIAVDVPGLNLEPQQSITTPAGVFTVDLAAYDSRIVVEADSFAWHSSKSALIRDARRYNALVAEAWLVLRLTWDAVMNDTATTVDLLTRVVDLQRISATCDACGHTRAQP